MGDRSNRLLQESGKDWIKHSYMYRWVTRQKANAPLIRGGALKEYL